ncbi:MAG TPA: AbrB/MazE/SpoVT family DNA-binding domain-containing protein [Candidatus Nanoarchaeia archaeon]|nr:AbrB/MazE/SpoVT family DNA-binding domain-containing protein [Candidatus Nanoarchaeia archaeon]
MKRKLVKQGKNALTVTLPSEWARMHSLTAGDEVDLGEHEGNIVISGKGTPKMKRVTINAADFQPFLKRVISTLYKGGYDEIEILLSAPQDIKDVKEALASLISFDIIEKQERRVIIKTLAVPDGMEYDAVMRRIFLMLLDMSEKTITMLKSDNYSLAEEIIDLESMNNKFTDYCKRLIIKQLLLTPDKTAKYYAFHSYLEMITDQYKYIAKQVSEKRLSRITDLVPLAQATHSFLEDFYKLQYSFTKERFVAYSKKRKQLLEDLFLTLERSKEKRIVHNLLNVVQLAYDASVSMSGIQLTREIGIS